MEYPTLEEIEKADREKIYFWAMALPLPRRIRIKRGRESKFELIPGGDAQKILDRIFVRWREFGGHDKEISAKVFKKLYPKEETK